MATLDRIERLCRDTLDERELRIRVLAEVRREVPGDAYAWLLTDPETSVGSAPLAETPSLADLPALIRLKYLTAVNRWTGLATGRAATLSEATAGVRSTSLVWDGLLSRYGVDDVLSTVFRDRFGCWAFLDLWRRGGTFTAPEQDLLGRVATTVTPALRRAVAATFAGGAAPAHHGVEPAVLLLSDDLEHLTETPAADAYLRALLPTDAGRAPVPAAAYNVAAQLLAVEGGVDPNPPSARVHLGSGIWMTLRAARMAGEVGGGSIAVSIGPTPPAARTELFARAAGLSGRETEILRHLAGGADTRELARRLFLSQHTVQDHLKSVFAKTGAGNRRILVARATGAENARPDRLPG